MQTQNPGNSLSERLTEDFKSYDECKVRWYLDNRAIVVSDGNLWVCISYYGDKYTSNDYQLIHFIFVFVRENIRTWIIIIVEYINFLFCYNHNPSMC